MNESTPCVAAFKGPAENAKTEQVEWLAGERAASLTQVSTRCRMPG